ncbi:helix-turn-helix transcriptional regulator [Nitrospira sp. CMX1]|nr:helix-turn-helix domain-containing protein [Nitrospira sp.]
MDVIGTLQKKQLLRVDEAAKILNVSRWTVYRWVEAGRLGGTRLGAGSLRIFSHTVAALIDLHCVGSIQEEGTDVLSKQGPLKSRAMNARPVGREISRLRQPAAV